MSRFVKLGVTRFVRSANATLAAVRLVGAASRLARLLYRATGVLLVPLVLTTAWAAGVLLAPACSPAQMTTLSHDVTAAEAEGASAAQLACLFANHVHLSLPPAEAEADAVLVAACGLTAAAAPAALRIVHGSSNAAASIDAARAVLAAILDAGGSAGHGE